MDSNKEIAVKIVKSIRQAKCHDLPMKKLENCLSSYLGALDSTFPKDIKAKVDSLVPRVIDQRVTNYAQVLNTSVEKDFDEDAGIGSMFDEIIGAILSYIQGMDIRIGCVGEIIKGERCGHFLKIEDDQKNTGGFLVLTSQTKNLDDGYFDNWVESEVDLVEFIKESAWQIQWLE